MQDLHTTKGGKSVVFRGDGEQRTIQPFLGNLNDFSATQTLEDDNFSIGGLVEQLEQTIAIPKYVTEDLTAMAYLFCSSGHV